MNNYSLKPLILTAPLISFIISPSAKALDIDCLQAPSRTKTCPNLVYRSVKTDDLRNKLFCFCKTDFQRLLDDNANDAQKAFNRMEWRQILSESGYTDKQLKRMVSK
ncbi:MAG: hypothetical protein HWE10_02230 [Gammaproteobacteria bacterium]|nr:hypothetical protein [Gammaproteobacteria bacterium]